MLRGFAGCNRSVVACFTGAGRRGVVETNLGPRLRYMAVRAGVGGREVVGGFAGCLGSVMATDAVSDDAGMVETERFPVHRGMAIRAGVGGGRMVFRFSCSALVVMTADAGGRRIGQIAAEVAGNAFELFVGAVEPKAGRVMVEARYRGLLGGGGERQGETERRRGQNERDRSPVNSVRTAIRRPGVRLHHISRHPI